MGRALAVCWLVAGTGLSVRAAEWTSARIFRIERFTRGDTGLVAQQPIDGAAWIWLEGIEFRNRGLEFLPTGPVFTRSEKGRSPCVRFACDFEADGSGFELDVSADQRYVLRLDGQEISRGPHKGADIHWYYQSYRIGGLSAGRHTLTADVFYLGDSGPLSIPSRGRGGFILKASGSYDGKLTTGKAPWRAGWVEDFAFGDYRGDPDAFTGADLTVRGTSFLDREVTAWQTPTVICGPVKGSLVGFHQTGWELFPTERPDMLQVERRPGKIAATQAAFTSADRAYLASDAEGGRTEEANALLRSGRALTVPPHRELRLLWDLGDYYCAFPVLTASGGRGAEIRWTWTESLFGEVGTNGLYAAKGDRRTFVGKCVRRGLFDTFRPDGRASARFTTPWWRSGRWAEISVRTGDEPLTVSSLSLVETRYPLAARASFDCDDASLAEINRICVRTLENCLHETYMDCPYFEQLMYPGDVRIEMLVENALTGDARINRFAIGLFDYTRRHDGMVRMSLPARDGQDSSTYAMCWCLTLGDYAAWQGADAFLKARIPGARQTLSQIGSHRNAGGLLEGLPGWNFIDWVNEWKRYGMPGEEADRVNALENLFYVMALRSVAKAERTLGNVKMAEAWETEAREVSDAVVRTFWNETRGLVADTPTRDRFSEHAQCLAILGGALDEPKAARAFAGLVSDKDLARTTVYFSHYLFETYFRRGRPDLFLDRLALWRGFAANGLSTAPEAPGIYARSDCHAWSAHPLYHELTGLAGIRPLEDGFRRVLVAPQPGKLKSIRARVPVRQGFASADLSFDSKGSARGTVVLPEGLEGVFRWRGRDLRLVSGRNHVEEKQ